jgi:hypothetical protein
MFLIWQRKLRVNEDEQIAKRPTCLSSSNSVFQGFSHFLGSRFGGGVIFEGGFFEGNGRWCGLSYGHVIQLGRAERLSSRTAVEVVNRRIRKMAGNQQKAAFLTLTSTEHMLI